MGPRPLALLATAWLAAAAPLRAGALLVDGVVSARGLVVEGQRSWLEGGFGRLGESGGGVADALFAWRGQAHVGIDWRPSLEWLGHAHGVAQTQPARAGGRGAGLVEAFVVYRPELSPRLSLRFKAGSYFPQTSRENVERLWSSPYTITLSALNTWIGEEVRLTGGEAGIVRKGERDELQLHAGAFGANDSSGTLLAWRGWAMGDRLVTLGEVFPLPPLRSLGRGGAFASQRDDGTRPIDELDGRVGWNARARWERKGEGLELIAEAADGKTGMGERSGPQVDVDFRAGYALLTWANEKVRLSARYDRFKNEARDGKAEPNGEDGRAWTFAAFFSPHRNVRLGVEYLGLDAQRPASADSGFDPDTSGRRAMLELRLLF